MMYKILKGNVHKISTIFGIEPRVLIKQKGILRKIKVLTSKYGNEKGTKYR